jgi:GT2 family glycosyltransferase
VQRSRVVIVVLHYGDAGLTLQCLNSLQHASFPVLVVDNGPEFSFAEKMPVCEGLECVTPGKNLFFAGGMNLGLNEARQRYSPDYYFLLNNDTLVEENTAQQLLEKMDAHPEVGITAPPVFHPDGTLWTTGRFLSPTLKMHENVKEQDESQRDYLSGTALFVREKALLQAGAFDEAFGLYFEDTELCYRFRKQGWGVHYFKAGRVIHWGSVSAGDQYGNLQSYYRWRNRFLFILKALEGGNKVFALACMLYVVPRDILRYLVMGKTKGLGRCFSGLFSLIKKNHAGS